MESILYPTKIQLVSGADERNATLTVEPLTQGYGTTIGNVLRRVLLSSLPGAAVTAVKIKGAPHEFGALPHVKEDILEIILQFKQLRLKSYSDEPVKLSLKAEGKRKVTAKDFQATADVEIVNPKLQIATLTDASAELELEITVERGRGYSPTEERNKQKLELGTIAIDALFSPVINVGFKVENVRVGEITNFDKLLLTVETDGSIVPKQAIEDAVAILMKHYALLEHLSEPSDVAEVSGESTTLAVSETVSEASDEKKEETASASIPDETEEKPKKRGRKKISE